MINLGLCKAEQQRAAIIISLFYFCWLLEKARLESLEIYICLDNHETSHLMCQLYSCAVAREFVKLSLFGAKMAASDKVIKLDDNDVDGCTMLWGLYVG